MNDRAPTLVTAGELAKTLSCAVSTIHDLRKRGKIRAYKFERAFRFDRDEVMEALRVEHENEQPVQ